MSNKQGMLCAGIVSFGKSTDSNIWYSTGETDKLEIQTESEVKNLKSKSVESYGKTVNSVALPGETKISLTLLNANKQNLLRFFLGSLEDIAVTAGSGSGGFMLEPGAELQLPQQNLETISINAAKSTLSIGAAVDDDALQFEAVADGTSGNDITVELIDPSGNDAVLSITVSDSAITVNLATDAGGLIITTALELLTALMLDVEVTAQLNVTHVTDSDGSGVVDAQAVTNLAGGTGFVEGDDYSVNKTTGAITVPVGSDIQAETNYLIEYTYKASTGYKIVGATENSINVPLKLDGVNLATNERILLICHNVTLTPSSGLDFMSDDFAKLEFEGVANLVDGKPSPYEFTAIEE